MRKNIIALSIFLSLLYHPYQGIAQGDDNLLARLLERDTSTIIQKVLANKDQYRLQIIYTRIDRDSLNMPSLRHYSYRLRPQEFFYSASMIKLPCAALALEKIKKHSKWGITAYTPFKPGANYMCYANSYYLRQQKPESLRQQIGKLLVVSDNVAYNLLYEFLGQQYIHSRFREMGYDSARIIQKFAPCSRKDCRTTGPIYFYKNGRLHYTQSREYMPDSLCIPIDDTLVGQCHWKGGKLIPQGFNFKYSNYISLRDLHQMTIAIMMPRALKPQQRFKLDQQDYDFLRKTMSMYPRELSYTYNNSKYYDAHLKYLLLGARKTKINPNIRIFNKVGEYFGFLTDCAYIVDYEHKVEFFLSAVIYTNKDGNINNGIYEYQEIGYPFLRRLGEILYEYEVQRPKKHPPQLSRYEYTSVR